MQRSSSVLVLLAFLIAGNAGAQSPEEQAAELEKAVADLEKTQEVVRVRQMRVRQALNQVREKQRVLQTVVRRLDAALERVGKLADATPDGHAPRASPDIYYTNHRRFEVPFEMEDDRSVRRFYIYASTDGKRYTRTATASPASKRFSYTASADGWYSFVVQVQEPDGSLTPDPIDSDTPPGARICVDTVKPVVALKAVAPALPDGGAVAVEWKVSDVNLDPSTLELQFAVQGGDHWETLNVRRMPYAQFSWNPQGTGPFDVKLRVSDRAGNTTTALTTVAPRPVLPPVEGVSAVPGGPRVIHVRGKTFKLNYKTDNVGPSNVHHVEVWMTRDTNVWNKYQAKSEAPASGPYEMTVPTSGRYGFTIRPLSGVGRGPRAPAPGQQPEIWIEVDNTAPQVALLGPVIVGEGDDSGWITINWRASDKFLRAKPITILYADKPDGEWKPIQANIENTGSCKCSVKDLPFEFYLKVEAVDEAGNKGSAQTRESVKVDLKIPAVKGLDVVGEDVEVSPKKD